MTAKDRINFNGDFGQLVTRVAEVYSIGELQNYRLIEVGYEDCNVTIKTEQGEYLAKMFAKTRTTDEIARYTDIIQKVVDAGVNHPKLLTTNSGEVVHNEGNISLVLMQFIDGKTYFELERTPVAEEREAVIEQASRINRIDYKPDYIFDTWAIVNIQTMFDKVKQFVEATDLLLVEQALARFNAIPLETLPYAFVHGDLTKANVMKGDDGKTYVFDFSVANLYPRIQELAVIVANLLHDKNDNSSLDDKCRAIADEYSLRNPLTDEERQYLPDYALAGIAMEFLGAHQEKYLNGIDNDETTYWMNLGLDGLKKALL